MLLLPMLAACLCLTESLVVQTKYGKVHGREILLDDETEGSGRVFYGVPFAAPPMGELRFQKPQAPEAWDKVKDCTTNAPECPQNYALMYGNPMFEKAFPFSDMKFTDWNEDCLTLDVYTPRVSGAGRAVMVWIHGGGLSYGGARFYDARVYAIRYNVVVVVIQYRLGSLGFMSFGDDTVSGNLGFQDQVYALHWVQENIANFGGDPNEVTIFGESAGSYSVNFHVISPASKGLFKRGILQSGALGFSAMGVVSKEMAGGIATVLANSLGCPNDTSTAMLSCFLEKPAVDLVILPPEYMMSVFFTAVLDGEIIPEMPADILKNKDYNPNVELIVGVCDSEGMMIGSVFSGSDLYTEEAAHTKEEFTEKIGQMTGFLIGGADTPEKIAAATEATAVMYLEGKEGGLMNRGYADFIGDVIITYPTLATAQYLKDHVRSTYLYNYAYKRSSSILPSYMLADHGDDLLTSFGFSEFIGLNPATGDKTVFNDDDSKVSRTIMDYWVNFAKTGNPNGAGLVNWDKYDHTDSYLELSQEPQMKFNLMSDRVEFYKTTLPSIFKSDSAVKEEL